jgi:hypothetical protein
VYSAKRAQKYINSLLTNVIRRRYGDRYIAVFERHESGAIHFHFILWLEKDVREGFDWTLADLAYEAQKQKQYSRAGKLWTAAAEKAVNGDFLREQWKFWRGLKKRYRWLGRCEMLPIKSTAEAIARYTGGYIGKHMEHRRLEDKGVKLVRYGKGMRRAKSRLAFNSPKGWLWRQKLEAFALENGCCSMDALKKKFGKRWAYRCAPAIMAIPLLVRFGDQIIDVGKFDARTAQELCMKYPRASGLHYRPSRLEINPEARARHEWKAGNLTLVRSVFGDSATSV